MIVADALVAALARAGARAVFGMPGGGSNLDVIDAARRQALPFVLSHTETAGAIMAAAQAEITSAPGVCLSTLGPGVASIVNGVAHACLDRVPLVVLTDAMDQTSRARFDHQNLAHGALLGPVTKLSAELTADGLHEFLQEIVARALAEPAGPVHLDCPPAIMTADAGLPPASPAPVPEPPCAGLTASAVQLLRGARRPIVIAGLGARRPADVVALRRFCEHRGVPVLVTYKAKGVLPDRHPLFAGLFTLGAVEKPLIDRADVLIAVGLDPVELLPRPWAWPQPVVHCTRWAPATSHIPAGETIIGDIAHALREIDDALSGATDWTLTEVAEYRERQRGAVTTDGVFTPGAAAAAIAVSADRARYLTVDAGAHMFPTMALVPVDWPRRLLISNGLSTMGYALPAAIGAALLAPEEPVVAITGDAGLLLCLGELRTLAREHAHVVVVVFADGALSLIGIKQERRGFDAAGVRIGSMDWPGVADAMGVRGFRAASAGELRAHLDDALALDGPSLIEAQIDPAGYGRMLGTLRG